MTAIENNLHTHTLPQRDPQRGGKHAKLSLFAKATATGLQGTCLPCLKSTGSDLGQLKSVGCGVRVTFRFGKHHFPIRTVVERHGEDLCTFTGREICAACDTVEGKINGAHTMPRAV